MLNIDVYQNIAIVFIILALAIHMFCDDRKGRK